MKDQGQKPPGVNPAARNPGMTMTGQTQPLQVSGPGMGGVSGSGGPASGIGNPTNTNAPADDAYRQGMAWGTSPYAANPQASAGGLSGVGGANPAAAISSPQVNPQQAGSGGMAGTLNGQPVDASGQPQQWGGTTKPMPLDASPLPASGVQNQTTPNTVNQVPTGNVPGMVGGDALGGAMKDAQGAAYQNAQGYLDPQWKNDQSAMEAKLANQGVPQNSEAWNKAMDDFGRQKEFAYSQARSGAVAQGNAAQSQLFNQGLMANQNQFGQNLQGAQFTNAVQQQLKAQGFTQQQIDNLEAQHRFDNSMNMRNQDINELMLQQQNPVNMLNALNGGGQVTQPNFTSTPNAGVNPTDIASMIQQQFSGQMGGYNAQTGAANSSNAGMAAIIAALICDRRLKTNIRKIGMHVVGVPLYAFDYIWGEPGIGVMADELEQVLPDAVLTHASGLKIVNMARLQ